MSSVQRLEKERILRGLIPTSELERREEELRLCSEQMLTSLTRNAEAVLKERFLQEIRPALVRTAKALWMVSRYRPLPEDAPGFYW